MTKRFYWSSPSPNSRNYHWKLTIANWGESLSQMIIRAGVWLAIVNLFFLYYRLIIFSPSFTVCSSDVTRLFIIGLITFSPLFMVSNFQMMTERDFVDLGLQSLETIIGNWQLPTGMNNWAKWLELEFD